ncbi:MAG: hypothetical protein WB760_33605 [Xanthobacteraceae bacterium]
MAAGPIKSRRADERNRSFELRSALVLLSVHAVQLRQQIDANRSCRERGECAKRLDQRYAALDEAFENLRGLPVLAEIGKTPAESYRGGDEAWVDGQSLAVGVAREFVFAVLAKNIALEENHARLLRLNQPRLLDRLLGQLDGAEPQIDATQRRQRHPIVRVQHGSPHQIIQRLLVIFPVACD